MGFVSREGNAGRVCNVVVRGKLRGRGEIAFGDCTEFPIPELSLVCLCVSVCVCDSLCVLAERGRADPDHEVLVP
jgi:hypothetical protein